MLVKFTKSQQQILDLLEQLDEEISAQDLHIKLRKKYLKIGLATVYRTVKNLHLQGIIQERINPNGESLYRLIKDNHEHHFNCVNCGISTILKGEYCPINQNLTNWCSTQNFKLYYHTLEFFGLCENCQNKV
ncbi:MAG: transcriptional repressor [Cyanobacteria bacterium]|uniref:Fur family transcriptional regulator n=1 Tax=Geminocystis sp. TaxID=2664100 RepID=UPI001DC961D5|nr:transcriptional repressor [Cyanobacteria bacterium CG_2015-16_32_12]NCO78005.1 transcriptional repressor [Cyanobacteria bacterium CG_2015-22_32_23]NCQ03256.1 transcriptional repressor [Cyanobacteria bacterium CG_2015-09_32_10]NCQ41114.1 transcriptional repressor [Cyanobacteria bacterium CG_2015-04_32_10]NCS85503.1 transcriptional repressor [Cyanobacteria bacterium CG_2015-02_32_10]